MLNHTEAIARLVRAQLDIVVQTAMSDETDFKRAITLANASIDHLVAAVRAEHGQAAEAIISEARQRLAAMQSMFSAWADA